MIVIVEGPDNGGKTTLAQEVAKKMKAVYVKVERPRRAVDLVAYQSILEVAKGYSGIVVSDRHVAISEPIYGNIIRGGHELRQADIDLCLGQLDAVIYCRPPLPVIMKTLSDRAQMDGVIDNATRIVQAYDEFFETQMTERRWGFMGVYDFLRDTPQVVIENLNQFHQKRMGVSK